MNMMRHIVTSALMLGLFTMVGTGMVAGVQLLTADRIAASQRAEQLKRLGEVIPHERYDNELLEDTLEFMEPSLNRRKPVVAYRARKNGQPVAAAFKVAAPNGYSGTINVLVGINYDGTISGVRILTHQETPGLGDNIQLSRTPWVLGFEGKSLHNPTLKQWAVKKDGGVFDQFTGATISPRAVVGVVKRTLLYFEKHRDEIFAPTGKTQETAS